MKPCARTRFRRRCSASRMVRAAAGSPGFRPISSGARHGQPGLGRLDLDAHRAQAIDRSEVDPEGHLDRLDAAVQGDLDLPAVVALRPQHLEQARAVVLGAAAQPRDARRRTIDQALGLGHLQEQPAQRVVADALDRHLVAEVGGALSGLLRRRRRACIVGLRLPALGAGQSEQPDQQAGGRDLPGPRRGAPPAESNPERTSK